MWSPRSLPTSVTAGGNLLGCIGWSSSSGGQGREKATQMPPQLLPVTGGSGFSPALGERVGASVLGVLALLSLRPAEEVVMDCPFLPILWQGFPGGPSKSVGWMEVPCGT